MDPAARLQKATTEVAEARHKQERAARHLRDAVQLKERADEALRQAELELTEARAGTRRHLSTSPSVTSGTSARELARDVVSHLTLTASQTPDGRMSLDHDGVVALLQAMQGTLNAGAPNPPRSSLWP